MLTLKVFKDKAGKWRWNLKAANGRKIATSGESFARRHNAERAARMMSGHLKTPHSVESTSEFPKWIDAHFDAARTP
jgi:uncharacterized protein YegP (UPF0339 family)